ncbi:MAG: T9SS type A sorting domain-containing protein [Flavobacteriales bacterium]
MDSTTGNDVILSDCSCAGQLIDCQGNPGGSALPGQDCDDGDPNTSGETWDANCNCTGGLVDDCLGVPGGSALPGTACDDGDPNTSGETWDANCNCTGGLVDDCLGVPGGSALPGTACDDGDPNTTGETWDANCNCTGGLVDDCLGVPGGSALPGTACDDGDINTVGDTWDANCNCVGIPAGSELVTLEITLDDQGSETTWEIRDETGTQVIQSGGPYADGQGGTVITETFPLVQTCYELVVLDAGGNGIADGGYTLYDSQSRRIITANGLFGSVSQTANGTDFCLPLSSQSLISSWCDRTDLVYANSTQIYASAQPGASGYQFWMFDPHGTYSRKVFITTQNLRPTVLVTNPVPADLDLNVRVRALVGGNYTAFGQACVIRLNSGIGVAQMRDVVFNEGAATNFVLWPNPNRGEVIYLKLDGLGEEMQNITIDIHDMFGKRVFAQELDNRGDVFNHTIDLGSDLAPGLYLVNLRVSDMLFTQRMVRQ